MAADIIRVTWDVDQTLAGGVVEAHARVYNEKLNLGIPNDMLKGLDGQYAKVFDVPEIKSFRDQGMESENAFQLVRTGIRTDRELHRSGLQIIPGAREAVLAFSKEFLHAGYYTVRPTEIRFATEDWLDHHLLPEPTRTVICADHLDKLRKVLNDTVLSYGGNVVLIDDQATKLADAAIGITDPTTREALQRLILINFGSKKNERSFSILPDSGIRLISIAPTWEPNNIRQTIQLIPQLLS